MERLTRFLKNELGLDAEKIMPLFEDYQRLLLEWNSRINLVSRKTESIEDHILNSIFFLSKTDLSRVHKLADIGTGGGFPGIPLKMIFPEIEVTLIDSIRKKIVAVEDIVERLGLKKITAVCARAEELGSSEKFRKKFDVVAAKAVAQLDILFTWCADLTANSGRMIFIKGGDTEEELTSLKKILRNYKAEEVNFGFDSDYRIEQKKIFIIKKA
jgi:16S rRNA (guanine527-N7)-methyltransferase